MRDSLQEKDEIITDINEQLEFSKIIQVHILVAIVAYVCIKIIQASSSSLLFQLGED